MQFKLADEDLVAPEQHSKVKNTFQSIAEEDDDDDEDDDLGRFGATNGSVDLRHQREMSVSSQTLSPTKKTRPVHLRLKHVQSVPQFPTYPSSASIGSANSSSGRPWSQSGETMTKDGIFIIQTPEVPAISMKRLPRNYLDTPSLDQYQEASSLTSIQMKNKQRGDDMFNFQMPRYYGRSDMYLGTAAISQEEINRANLRAKQFRVSLKKNRSMVNLNQRSASPDPKSASTMNIMHAGRSEGHLGSSSSLSRVGLPGSSSTVPAERSKRLKVLRGNLPPLMIQTKDKATAAEKDRH